MHRGKEKLNQIWALLEEAEFQYVMARFGTSHAMIDGGRRLHSRIYKSGGGFLSAIDVFIPGNAGALISPPRNSNMTR